MVSAATLSSPYIHSFHFRKCIFHQILPAPGLPISHHSLGVALWVQKRHDWASWSMSGGRKVAGRHTCGSKNHPVIFILPPSHHKAVRAIPYSEHKQFFRSVIYFPLTYIVGATSHCSKDKDQNPKYILKVLGWSGLLSSLTSSHHVIPALCT